MNLAICSFASSSSGNSFLIKSESTKILIDVGTTMKKLDENLAVCQIAYEDLSAVVLTHDHIDHIKGINTLLCRRPYKGTVYATKGTENFILEKHPKLSKGHFATIGGGERFLVGDIQVGVFAISHDAAEPVGYTFEKDGKKIVFVTDTGCVTDKIFNAIRGADVLVIEANHEKNILLYGKYPYTVKHRILSDEGHLSNESTGYTLCRYLSDLDGKKKPEVLLAHLSKENNSPAQAFLTVKNILEEEGFYIGKDLELGVAKSEGFDRFLTV